MSVLEICSWLVVWLAAGLTVALALGAVIRRRDTQVPEERS